MNWINLAYLMIGFLLGVITYQSGKETYYKKLYLSNKASFQKACKLISILRIKHSDNTDYSGELL